LRQRVQHLARGFAAGDALGVGRTDRQVAVPPGRQLAPLHLVDLGRELGVLIPVGAEKLCPLLPSLRAARSHTGCEVLADAVRDQELGVLRPAVGALAKANLVIAERLAVGLGCVLPVWGTVADVAVQDEESGPAFGPPENLQ